MRLTVLLAAGLTLVSCSDKKKETQVSAPPLEKIVSGATKLDSLVSHEVFSRLATKGPVYIRQIYLVYDKISPRFGRVQRGHGSRGDSGRRPRHETIAMVKKLLGEIKKGADFKDLMVKYSDDPNSGPRSLLMEVLQDGPPTKMKSFAPRLKLGEVGVFSDQNAYRIVKRVPPPPKVKDIDSKEILARKPDAGKVSYKVIHVGWRLLKQIYAGNISHKAILRNQAQAAELALSLVKQLNGGADFEKLYKEFTETIPKGITKHQHHFGPLAKVLEKGHGHGDKGHGDKGHGGHEAGGHDDAHLNPAERMARDADASLKATQLVKIHRLALRLKIGETGVVLSKFGYHVVKRYK